MRAATAVTPITRRNKDSRTEEPTDWSYQAFTQGHPQGHMVVVSNSTSASVNDIVGFKVPDAPQDNRLVYVFLQGVDLSPCVVACCHTPYLGTTAANRYNSLALNQVIKKAHFAIPANHPDLWMGDLNAYSPLMFSSRVRGKYLQHLALPTSGFGRRARDSHSSLDRILKREDFRLYDYGRVIPVDIHRVSGDITERDWTSATVPSDHLPIYADTSPVGAAIAPPPPVVTPTSGTKRTPPTLPSKKRRKKS